MLFSPLAGVAKLADALDSKSGIRKDVWVRTPPPVGSLRGEFLFLAKSFLLCSKVETLSSTFYINLFWHGLL